MNDKIKIPPWLILWLWQALLGEIYPNIRAIAVSFSDNRELRVRYYLDRPPTSFDYESLGYVMTYVLSNTSSNEDIKSVKEEREYSTLPLGELNTLDGIVFARREYDMSPTPRAIAGGN
jgi:hypothetical protein